MDIDYNGKKYYFDDPASDTIIQNASWIDRHYCAFFLISELVGLLIMFIIAYIWSYF